MGMPTAQIGQSINQQQPQGIGASSAPVGPNALGDARSQLATIPVDSTMSGASNQNIGKGSGKSGQSSQPSTTNSATSGQPRMGQSNPYPNTIQPWDNANIQTQSNSGKGKGH